MIRLSRSIVGEEEANAVSKVIEGGYLGMGKDVQLFEQELADFIGVPSENVVCVNSGTAALQLAVQAALVPGDEILVQSLTFVATFQAISAAGMVPKACEVYDATLGIDLEDAARRINDRTKAIMPVHYASNPGPLDRVYEFARQHGLRVIEDAAHAFGCRYQSALIGSIGDICCFSFDGIKNITSGEGGAVVTSDHLAAQRIRDARLLGIEHDTQQRYLGQRSWEFDVKYQGWRYHMSNIFAAIGRVQLRRFNSEFKPKRIALAQQYCGMLSGLKSLQVVNNQFGDIIPHIFPVRVFDGKRDALRQYLQENSVETGVHYLPNHLLTLYGGGCDSLPVTEKLHAELLSLPLHPGMTEEDVASVCDLIKKVL